MAMKKTPELEGRTELRRPEDPLHIFILTRIIAFVLYTGSIADIASRVPQAVMPFITALCITAILDVIVTVSSVLSYRIPDHPAIRAVAYLTQLTRFGNPIVLPPLLLSSILEHQFQMESIGLLIGYLLVILWPLLIQVWDVVSGNSKNPRTRR